MSAKFAHRHKIHQTSGFTIFCSSMIAERYFKVYSQEVKTECKLNCNRALRRCRLNSRSATYICNAPLEHKMNFRCALLVNFHSATHICKNGICTSISGTPGLTELPELNTPKPLLWLVQFLILIISLAEYFQLCNFLSVFTSCE
jgi:hypothetical protein